MAAPQQQIVRQEVSPRPSDFQQRKDQAAVGRCTMEAREHCAISLVQFELQQVAERNGVEELSAVGEESRGSPQSLQLAGRFGVQHDNRWNCAFAVGVCFLGLDQRARVDQPLVGVVVHLVQDLERLQSEQSVPALQMHHHILLLAELADPDAQGRQSVQSLQTAHDGDAVAETHLRLLQQLVGLEGEVVGRVVVHQHNSEVGVVHSLQRLQQSDILRRERTSSFGVDADGCFLAGLLG